MINSHRSGSFIPSSVLLKCLDLWKKFKYGFPFSTIYIGLSPMFNVYMLIWLCNRKDGDLVIVFQDTNTYNYNDINL
jgi:hypothetical protein